MLILFVKGIMHKIDKIYFDIDGVIKGIASPKSDVVDLLWYCIHKYPDSLYWLTTHCRSGVNNVKYVLRGELPDELADKMCDIFHPTDWEVLKTDAIDMDSDFVWFDDNLFESERQVLVSNYVLDGFFRMNPKNPEMAKKALEFLKSFKSENDYYSIRKVA